MANVKNITNMHSALSVFAFINVQHRIFLLAFAVSLAAIHTCSGSNTQLMTYKMCSNEASSFIMVNMQICTVHLRSYSFRPSTGNDINAKVIIMGESIPSSFISDLV